MFVNMWMTRDVISVAPESSLAEVAGVMSRHRIRRLPVVQGATRQLVGIISYSDVLHAFPANLNPFSADAVEQLAQPAQGRRVCAADLMARDPATTSGDAPIEAAARVMRKRKIGALPVVQGEALVGMITESDIFRALVEMFEPTGRAVRITFALHGSEDVLPLVADIAKRRDMRVTSFFAMSRHEPPLAVVQVSGAHIEETLEDVWKSKHRVMSVVHLEHTDGGM
jgi:acetoin utilization protein AcuB